MGGQGRSQNPNLGRAKAKKCRGKKRGKTLKPTDITLVLVGKIGNGKSATANTILGRKAFVSKYSQTSVTSTCHLERRTLHDGRTVDIIDTPGLFDMNIAAEEAGRKIVECMKLAKDGIHAVLMVFSAACRFSPEDANTLEMIKMFFGEKIVDHMILVFTYGDLVEETEWKEMLRTAPDCLQKMVELCKNRVVLFDNRMRDGGQQYVQLTKLIDVVDSVIASNDGKPFLNQMFTEIKEAHDRRREDVKGFSEEQRSELKREMLKSWDEQIAETTRMVVLKLIDMLQQQLQEEQRARREADKNAEEQIRELNDKLEKASQNKCVIQ